MNCKDIQSFIHSYLDDELAVDKAAAIAKHLESCEACRHSYEEQRLLRSAIRQYASDCFPIPVGLRDRIESRLFAVKPVFPKAIATRPYLVNAAALFIAAIIAIGSVTFLITKPDSDERFADEAISGHLRSLLADHLTDIASSDPQAVQNWLSSRLSFSPTIKDLTAHGFQLAGSRLDYLYKRKVAAVIYQHGSHTVNLFVWPSTTARDSPIRVALDDGYSILLWTASGMNFCSISDLDEQILIELAKIYGAKSA